METPKLYFTLVEGVNLSDDGTARGKCDPYVSVTLDKEKWESSKKKNVRNMTWNEEHIFNPPSITASGPNPLALDVTVMDFDRFSKDDLIGQFRVSLSEFESFEEKDLWFTIVTPADKAANPDSANVVGEPYPSSSKPQLRLRCRYVDEKRRAYLEEERRKEEQRRRDEAERSRQAGGKAKSGKPWIGLGLEHYPRVEGSLVTSVQEGSPASYAGLQNGDVITKVNSFPGEGLLQSRRNAALRIEPGAVLDLQCDRAGKIFYAKIVIGTLPEEAKAATAAATPAETEKYSKIIKGLCFIQILLALFVSLYRLDITGVLAVIGMYSAIEMHKDGLKVFLGFLLWSILIDIIWCSVEGAEVTKYSEEQLQDMQRGEANAQRIRRFALGISVVQLLAKPLVLFFATKLLILLRKVPPTDRK